LGLVTYDAVTVRDGWGAWRSSGIGGRRGACGTRFDLRCEVVLMYRLTIGSGEPGTEDAA